MSTAKEELQKIPVTEWTKNTVADGIYLNKNTIKPLVNRDEALANKIDNDVLPIINNQNDRITNAETCINDAVNKVTNITDKVDNNDKRITTLEEWKPAVDDTLEEHDIHLSAIDEINNEFQSEINDLHNEDTSIWTELDKMQAASDVVQVFGSYHEFQEASATMSSWITDQDIVKVLHDEHDDADQVYYRYYSAGNIYENIGSLSPYYSVTEIDTLFTTLSATIDSEIETINENIETSLENLNGKITAEQERAEAEESELSESIGTVETTLTAKINSEETRATTKENELDTKINNLENNLIFNPELPLAFSDENGPNKKLVINYDSDIFSMNENNEFIINIITTKEINDLD